MPLLHRPLWISILSSIALSCSGGAGSGPASTGTHVASQEPQSAGGDPAEDRGDQGGEIDWYEDGTLRGRVSREGAARRGLTVVDLGDEWTAYVFQEDTSLGNLGHQPYRQRLLRLADERTANQRRRDDDDRYLELYGIFPTIRVLKDRLGDQERHACHEAIDNTELTALDRALRVGNDQRQQRARAGMVRQLERELGEVVEHRQLASIDDLAHERRYERDYQRLVQARPTVHAIRAVQGHLRCDGFLNSRADDGVLDAWTAQAVRVWQRKHMIIALGGTVDEVTRRSFGTGSRELDFLALLRALRERVVDASGTIEDGSALGQWGTVLDRRLDLDDEFRWVDRLPALENGAPDLVAQNTDAAARALGWTDPEHALAWLNEHAAATTPTRLVAVRLPPPPAYHSAHMDLHVQIDRGDVWYSEPYTADGRPRGFGQVNRPITTIFVRHEGREIPLVRWNTTIGGWQPEINPTDGVVGLRYKESDVGPRVWRDVIATPTWMPPPGTPDDELLNGSGEDWHVNRSVTGPGYDSAYGLTLVIHHIMRDDGSEPDDFVDRGIRSHGSVNYRSILRGYSHGCHRLFNHLAVRMTSFLLRHRTHATRGFQPALFRRELHPEGTEQVLTLEIDTRGYLYELTPPIPVEVLRGNVHGGNRAPAGFFPLPEQLQEQARLQATADPSTAPIAPEAPGIVPPNTVPPVAPTVPAPVAPPAPAPH